MVPFLLVMRTSYFQSRWHIVPLDPLSTEINWRFTVHRALTWRGVAGGGTRKPKEFVVAFTLLKFGA
jgi:hypothetical protein